MLHENGMRVNFAVETRRSALLGVKTGVLFRSSPKCKIGRGGGGAVGRQASVGRGGRGGEGGGGG